MILPRFLVRSTPSLLCFVPMSRPSISASRNCLQAHGMGMPSSLRLMSASQWLRALECLWLTARCPHVQIAMCVGTNIALAVGSLHTFALPTFATIGW